MAVTLLLVFGAVTHERNVPFAGKLLDEAQRELLAVVLDRPALTVDRAVEKQFPPVGPSECGPRDLSGQKVPQQTLARSQARNPHVVARRGHPASAETRDEKAQAVLPAVYGRPDGFGREHWQIRCKRLR